MDIQLSPQLKREVAAVRGYGFRSANEFIEDAVRHRILEFKSAVKLTAAQKRDLGKSREEIRKGDYVALEELEYEVGIKNTKKR